MNREQAIELLKNTAHFQPDLYVEIEHCSTYGDDSDTDDDIDNAELRALVELLNEYLEEGTND